MLTNYTEFHVDSTERVSGELFNILTTSVEGDPLQILYICNLNGVEVWRPLSKMYSPTTLLRAMHLILQIVSPEKTKDFKHVQTHIDWESKILERFRRAVVREDERIDPHLDARKTPLAELRRAEQAM